MAGREIEIILSRQWADYLSVPVFITDREGNLIFYNEPAEDILGKRFEDTGPMPIEEWSVAFNPTDSDGQPIPPRDLPLVRTLQHAQPAFGEFWILSLTGVQYHLSVSSFPIVGLAGKYLGAIAVFWEKSDG